MKKAGVAFVLGFSVVIGACSGDGSSSLGVSYSLPTVPAAGVAITAANAEDVARDTLTASVGAASAGPGGVSGIVASGQPPARVKLYLDKAVARANKLLLDQLSAPPLPAGVSHTVFCNSVDASDGTIVLTQQGNNERIDYNNCDLGGVVVDGSLAATNISYSGNPPTPPFSLSATYTYNLTFTYSTGSVAMMGRFDLAMSATASTLTSSITNGEMGVITSVGSVVMTNISNSQSCVGWSTATYACTGTLTVSNNFTVGGTLSNGTYTVATTTPLQIDVESSAEFPHTGVIEVTGDNNSYLRITILDDEIDTTEAANDIEIYVDPDTTNPGDETTVYYNWSTI